MLRDILIKPCSVIFEKLDIQTYLLILNPSIFIGSCLNAKGLKKLSKLRFSIRIFVKFNVIH